VRCDRVIIICIMALWSWSTLQFTLVITAAQARKSRAVGIYEEEGQSSRVQSPDVVVKDGDERKGTQKLYTQYSKPAPRYILVKNVELKASRNAAELGKLCGLLLAKIISRIM